MKGSPYITHRVPLTGERFSHRRDSGIRCAICARHALYRIVGIAGGLVTGVALLAF